MNSMKGCPSIHTVHTVGTFRLWSDGKFTWSQISELEHWIAVSHTESLRAAFVPLVSERWRRNSRLQFSLTYFQKYKIHVHRTSSLLEVFQLTFRKCCHGKNSHFHIPFLSLMLLYYTLLSHSFPTLISFLFIFCFCTPVPVIPGGPGMCYYCS